MRPATMMAGTRGWACLVKLDRSGGPKDKFGMAHIGLRPNARTYIALGWRRARRVGRNLPVGIPT